MVQAAREVVARGGEPWLLGLRTAGDDDEVRAHLMGLMGVGRKVADCVALMSLDRRGLVPIDVHMARIGERDYRFRGADGPGLAASFRGLWGEDAGWAQVRPGGGWVGCGACKGRAVAFQCVVSQTHAHKLHHPLGPRRVPSFVCAVGPGHALYQ